MSTPVDPRPECRRCEFWEDRTHAENAPKGKAFESGWGRCRAAEHDHSLAMPVSGVSVMDDADAGAVYGFLQTHARFGCNQFEPRKF